MFKMLSVVHGEWMARVNKCGLLNVLWLQMTVCCCNGDRCNGASTSRVQNTITFVTAICTVLFATNTLVL